MTRDEAISALAKYHKLIGDEECGETVHDHDEQWMGEMYELILNSLTAPAQVVPEKPGKYLMAEEVTVEQCEYTCSDCKSHMRIDFKNGGMACLDEYSGARFSALEEE